MTKKLLSFLMGSALVLSLAACGGADDDNAEKPAENDGEETTAEAGDAEAIYNKSCVSCHGENLEGDMGPALDKVGASLSKDEILDVIENGRGQMPPGTAKGEDAEKVAEWLAEKK